MAKIKNAEKFRKELYTTIKRNCHMTSTVPFVCVPEYVRAVRDCGYAEDSEYTVRIGDKMEVVSLPRPLHILGTSVYLTVDRMGNVEFWYDKDEFYYRAERLWTDDYKNRTDYIVAVIVALFRYGHPTH